ncbi:MAG TPA: hypothetical protein VFP98_03740, partial [Candidatus Polarisedimenticolia bacterium]|nr:hypothetical protein [Candidatus Polarisedimenticolia bacterium]
VYGPPVGGPAGAPGLGVATVKVTAALHHRLDRSGPVPVVPAGMAPIARSVVRMGLAEIPANSPRGPLESCGDITARGVLRARWGRVIAVGDVTLAVHLDTLDATVASAFPYASYGRRLSGLSPGGDLADWLDDPDTSIEDPWLKVVAGGDLVGHASRPDQPYPYDQAKAVDIDHSNLFQRVAGITCPSFDYALWKRIALSSMPGDRHVHYFAFDAPTGLFRENGTGPARSVRDFTHGRQGIFFFDTVDGSPPAGGNLTPAVSISGGEWSTAGVVYLNAVSFRVASVAGVERVLIPPGEPFDDPDHDLAHAPFETWVNLRYPTSLTGAASDLMHKDPVASQSLQARSPDGETHEASTTTLRDASGLPVASPVNLFGVLFNAGNIVAEGDAVHYGSLVAGGDVVQTTWGADTPIIYFDERLNTGSWPPPEIAMPRTFVTFWQTSRP